MIYHYNLTKPKDIIIRAYKNDSSFTTLLDSFKITKIENPGYDEICYYCYLNKKIKINYDYDFHFVELDTHCKITGIKVKKMVCNDGLDDMFFDGHTYSFDEYYVNNAIFKCQILKVFPY